MIDKLCKSLTSKIRAKMPEVDDERAEVIYFGLRVIIGEVPKVIIMLWVAWALNIFEWTLFTFIVLLPYKAVVGGTHLKTEIGCLVLTILFYLRNTIYIWAFCIIRYSKIYCNRNGLDIWNDNDKLICSSRYRKYSDIR